MVAALKKHVTLNKPTYLKGISGFWDLEQGLGLENTTAFRECLWDTTKTSRVNK